MSYTNSVLVTNPGKVVRREAYLSYGSLLIVLPDLILRALGSSVQLRFLRCVAIFCPHCASLHEGCFGGEIGGQFCVFFLPCFNIFASALREILLV